MVDLSSAVTTTFIGMFGVAIGAIISNYVNQRIAARSARRELLFKKKVEYFDRTVTCIEKNIKLYSLWKKKLEVNATPALVTNALKALKKERAKFDPLSSALYFDIQMFSRDIKHFVALEKQIFSLITKLTKDNHEETLDALRQSLHRLERVGQSVILKMRNSLTRD